jgi:uncharacterized protein
MKRRYAVSLAAVILVVIAVFAVDYYFYGLPRIPVPSDPRAQTGLSVVPVVLPDGTRIAAEVARTSMQRVRGLMYRNVVPPQTGMLFVDDITKIRQIWMKNVPVDLDIVFIGQNKQITHIARNVKRSPEGTPDDVIPRVNGYGMYILELAAGEADRLNLKKGMTLSFL